MSRAQEIADLLSGVTITTADNTAQLTLTSTDADANHGPRLDLKRDSGSPADNDTVGRLRFLFDNDAAEETEAVRIDTFIPDVSDGTEDATFQILTMVGGTIRSRVEHNSTETVFNQDSIDLDFRIESNGNANMLVVDAGTDKIGIGTAAPTVTLEVANASNPALSGVTNRNPIIQLTNTDTGYVAGNATAIDFATSLNYTNASIICRNDNSGSGFGGSLIFATSPTSGNSLTERMRILPTGGLTFNGDTAAANALDDYEEGTFTPSFTGGITGSSYGDQNGTYVKIGQLVFFAIELDVTNGQASTNGNQIIIDNIPFASAASSPMVHSQGGAWVTFNNNFYNVDTGVYLQIPTNTNQIKLYRGSGNALVGNETGVNAQNDFHIAGCYRTA